MCNSRPIVTVCPQGASNTPNSLPRTVPQKTHNFMQQMAWPCPRRGACIIFFNGSHHRTLHLSPHWQLQYLKICCVVWPNLYCSLQYLYCSLDLLTQSWQLSKSFSIWNRIFIFGMCCFQKPKRLPRYIMFFFGTTNAKCINFIFILRTVYLFMLSVTGSLKTYSCVKSLNLHMIISSPLTHYGL